MTIAELHSILDDKNKKISLKEFQEILFQLKYDTVAFATKEDFVNGTSNKYYWYNGETNAFQIALDLSEHIKE